MSNDLYYPDDSAEMRTSIARLLEEGFDVERCTQFQLKCLDVSFYPGRGTIVVDPHHRQKYKGLEAFLDLLRERRSAVRSSAKQSPLSRPFRLEPAARKLPEK